MAYYDGDFDQFLEDRLKRSKVARSSIAITRYKNGKNGSLKFNRKLIWLSVTYLVIIGLLFSSFGTAYAAMDSLPNNPLYAVKLAGEDLQLLLTTDTAARISLLTTFANRRADETTILAAQGQPVPEQLSALIDEYQEEIDELAAIMVNENDADGVYRQLQPRDQDNIGGIYDQGDQNQNRNTQPALEPDIQTALTVDSEIPDTTTSLTGTIGITGTMNMTQTRSGDDWGPGPCETVGGCDALGEEHSPGPYTYSYYDDEAGPPHTPGIYEGYGPGYAGVLPQQPIVTNPLMDNGNSNQSSENKGNQP
ncbi:MAG: DUF5667 domain-containing protein [Anaerolineales bacterium]